MSDFDTYSESWPETINLNELERELARHGTTVDEFMEENPEYKGSLFFDGQFVLGWLGY
tara:strand:+ start:258 stop:434 length:177 start_codon:yes stop_codon:yes gene_type:complete